MKCKGWETDPNAYIYVITQAAVWLAICDLIGKPEWKEDPGYAAPKARLDKLAHIFDTIEEWTKTKTKFEAMDILNPLNVPCGPILTQKEVAIGPDDTLGSVYFNHLFPMGVDAMMESLALVKSGNAPRTEQDHSKATYESWCGKKDVRIDWSKPANEVYNLIRGCNPAPGAWAISKSPSSTAVSKVPSAASPA